MGETRFSQRVRREAGDLIAEVVHRSGPDLSITLVFDAPSPEVPAVTLNGVRLGSEALRVENRFGHAVITLPDCPLRSGGACLAVLAAGSGP